MRIRPHTVAMTSKLLSPKCLFLLALATAGSSMAATKITYAEILKHVGNLGTVERRGVTVTTADGKTHKGRSLEFHSDHLTVSRGKFQENLAASTVTRIEISQAGRFFHHLVEGAQLVGAAALDTHPLATASRLRSRVGPVFPRRRRYRVLHPTNGL
jgi:hypothetical protein